MSPKKLYFTVTAALSVALLQTPGLAFAANEKITETNYASITDFVNGIKSYLLGFVGALAVLIIIYSGFQYITSAGDAEKAKTAKKTLTYAVMGLIFIALAEVILTLLNSSIIDLFGTGKHQI